MTKPLPTGSIKKPRKKITSMREFDLIVQGMSDKDKIGHLFVVDIEFDHENANKKQLFLMKYTLQFLKKRRFSLPMVCLSTFGCNEIK